MTSGPSSSASGGDITIAPPKPVMPRITPAIAPIRTASASRSGAKESTVHRDGLPGDERGIVARRGRARAARRRPSRQAAPAGCARSPCSRISGVSMSCVMSVSTTAGEIALTRMPRGPSSRPRPLVSATTPALVVPYQTLPMAPPPFSEDTEARLMIEAPARPAIAGSAAWMQLKMPVRFTATKRSHSSPEVRSAGPEAMRPASFTRMSRPPCSAATRPMAAWTAARSVTSRRSPGDGRMSARHTTQPSCSKRAAMAAPIPRAAPVTNATLPSRRFMPRSRTRRGSGRGCAA